MLLVALTAAPDPVAASAASPPDVPEHGVGLLDADHSEGEYASDPPGLDAYGATHGGRHLLDSQVRYCVRRTLALSFHPHRAAPREEPAPVDNRDTTFFAATQFSHR